MGSGEEPLRRRFCRGAGCGVVFWICRYCDRGHQYCGERCRTRGPRVPGSEVGCRLRGRPRERMIALFGWFAEVERDPISERTKEGLIARML